MVLTRVLGVAGGGVGMAGELSGTVQRQARWVWALRTINDGSAMNENATKLDLTLAVLAEEDATKLDLTFVAFWQGWRIVGYGTAAGPMCLGLAYNK